MTKCDEDDKDAIAAALPKHTLLQIKWWRMQSKGMVLKVNFEKAYDSLEPDKEFKIKRALKQGDPLPWLLFLLVAESLNVLMLEARENGLFEGVAVGREEVELSRLKYTEDAIFFSKW
ncbi:hypothetical protein OSB04_006817 [Centaurea solstitialis]|uniref:Reverse transcriptase n=1 Tax=Centaurea solstitialis TaxID=347529 RepID=A0AA38U1X0_9ASTR|nr:hypothetical protein OSB04_006816 [Centaurea solstitialis]KAJ9561657.1 hypothetical protein OSB04_006817 [Centaurea solstitialis]